MEDPIAPNDLENINGLEFFEYAYALHSQNSLFPTSLIIIHFLGKLFKIFTIDVIG